MSLLSKSADPAPATTVDGITRLERGIVFRVARGYFILMSVAALILLIAGAVVWVVVSFQPREPGPAPIPLPAPTPPPPASNAITYGDVAAQRKGEADAKVQAASSPTEVATPTKAAASKSPEPKDTSRAKFERLLAELRELLPDPPYPWQDLVENYCAENTAYGCLRRDVRTKTRGIARTLADALKGEDQDGALEELGVLVAVLKQAPLPERGELVTIVVAMEKERLAEDVRQRREYKAAVSRQEQEYADAVSAERVRHDRALAEEEAHRARWRERGVYGTCVGFALIIVTSLFLAFLAMERHLRVLQSIMSGNAVRGDQSSSPPTGANE